MILVEHRLDLFVLIQKIVRHQLQFVTEIKKGKKFKENEKQAVKDSKGLRAEIFPTL